MPYNPVVFPLSIYFLFIDVMEISFIPSLQHINVLFLLVSVERNEDSYVRSHILDFKMQRNL